jgi:hypothetical protein
MLPFIKYVGVFLLVAFLDFMWAQYIKHTAVADALKSASYSMAIYLLGCLVTIAYVEDHKMMVPCALGAFAGTYLSAVFSKRKGDTTSP